MAKLIIIFNLIVVCCLISSKCERTKDKMYDSIIGASCFRRLNATHSTGCSSKFGGSVGVLHLIESESDFEFVLTDPPAPPYALIIPPHLFTRNNIMPLKRIGIDKISAVILIHNQTNLQSFSQELNCPNAYSGFSKQPTCDAGRPETAWNPFGTGLLHENFPFPIYFVADTEEIGKLTDCYQKFNGHHFTEQHQRSLCSIQVNTFMSAAVNSRVCRKRSTLMSWLRPIRFCDPLQGKNVYATLYPREIVKPDQTTKATNEKFILVSTRIDTTSMFDGLGLGALDSLVPYATLVSTAHMLSTLLPERIQSNHPNVLFVIFNGESYDYIGSQRFVYDLTHQSFPSKQTQTGTITWENIDYMIDIGSLDNLSNISLYRTSQFGVARKIKTLIDKYKGRYSINFGSEEVVTDDGYPPISSQSFLRENQSFPVVGIHSLPTNKFYHSIYDDGKNIDFIYQNTTADFTVLKNIGDSNAPFPIDSIQVTVSEAATILATTLYELVTGLNYDGTKTGNPVLADELLFCFLQSADCPLFRAASHPHSLPALQVPPQRYISVQGSLTYESVGWTYRILGYLIGQRIVDLNEKNCTLLPLYWYAGVNGTGQCHLTTQNFSYALSPAFIDENYDWSSGRYSTWTESTWSEMNARIFLRPSKMHEAYTLATGFVVMVISFVLVFLIYSKSDVLFGDFVPDTIRGSTSSDATIPC